MRYTWILLLVGVAIGTVVGVNAADEISAFGGETKQHILQVGTIGQYAGVGGGIGFVLGLIVDSIRGIVAYVLDRRLMRHYGDE